MNSARRPRAGAKTHACWGRGLYTGYRTVRNLPVIMWEKCAEYDANDPCRGVCLRVGFRDGERNLRYAHVNRPEKGRTCRACHETHASNKAKYVRDWVLFGSSRRRLPINFEQTETGGRCGPGCHRAYGYDRVKPVINHPAQRPAARPEATTAPRGEGKDEKKGSQS